LTIFPHLHLLHSPPTNTPHHTYFAILSFFITKSIFKGVSWCIPTVHILYFGQFNSFHYSPLPFSPTSYYSTAFSTYCCILYLHPCNAFWYCLLSIILFSFPSSPEFHRIVSLLQTCSTYNFVYHVCFVYLSFGSIFHIWEKTCNLFLSESGLLHLMWFPSIYRQTTWFYSSFWLNKTPLYR
jgi:hypothetical protein